MEKSVKISRTLSVFMLTMINVATIGSVKNWPTMAEYGLSSVFFFLLGALIFFIPSSLVSAELATGWPKLGGVFVWVKEAFGHRFGFLAAWLLWCQTVVWYPTALSFVASALAFIFDPVLAQNKLFTFLTIFILFWASTLINFRGMRTSGWISSVGMILGTFFPGIVIIALGLFWLLLGKPSQIDWSWNKLIPNMNSPHQLALFTGVMISLAGIEMSAVHARDVQHPKKDYPRAIFWTVLTIIGLSIPGILAIAIVIPQQNISLVAGSLQAIQVFLDAYNLRALGPLLCLLIAVGAISSVSTWIVGPTKGLLAAAQSGDLPPLFRQVNKQAMPVSLLVFQGIIASILATFFIFLPSLNEAYLILMVIVSELYLLMYLLMFAAAIKLRYTKPHVERSYKVPGGNKGMWIIASLGFLAALFAIIIGFFPPEQLPIQNKTNYVLLLLGSVLIFVLGPSIILLFQKPSWKKALAHERLEE